MYAYLSPDVHPANAAPKASSGDFPTVLYDVVSKRSSVIQGSLTIEELNQLLDELAAHSGKQ